MTKDAASDRQSQRPQAMTESARIDRRSILLGTTTLVTAAAATTLATTATVQAQQAPRPACCGCSSA